MKQQAKYSLCIILALIMLFSVSNPANAQSKEPVVFENDDLVLHGTIIMPESAGPSPMILYLGGVNEFGRYDNQREVFIAEILEGTFPEMGIGIMYYDPRGLGKTDGRWQRTSIEEFSSDAVAAVEYLRNRRDVDISRIGIIAQGEDGWIAYNTASQIPDALNFVTSLGTPPFDSKRQLINEYYNDYRCAGQDSSSAMQKAERKAISHQNWVSVLPITRRWRHMKLFQDYDPSAVIADLKVKTMMLFGENDGEVYPLWANESLSDIFSGSIPEHISVQTISGANHEFMVADRCYERGKNVVAKNFSTAFKDSLKAYVKRNFFEDSFFSN
ncbi:alpha/beta hydrolase family protein [Balneola sp. MJW-20]|uniref:alpha/beta hydrolase family protein n=1 Tax=Gracilimonas aurantiaca TaxID=3234185 RepID=UPI003467910F